MTDNHFPIQHLAGLFASGPYEELITTHWEKQEQSAQLVDFPQGLSPLLVDFLKSEGLTKLYTHQELSYKAIRNGENVVISTGTSSERPGVITCRYSIRCSRHRKILRYISSPPRL
jgi:DEAD/DEAH box helicase domain-containing protein